MDDEPAFGSAAEINALLLWHRQAVAKVKERALSLFKRVESEDDPAIYSYLVTIPKTKTTLFHLALRYVSCGTWFHMAFELIGCTYDVLGNLSLRACSRDKISNFVRVVYAVNLQQIVDLLRRSWAFSLALDFATHQSSSRAPHSSIYASGFSFPTIIPLLTCMDARFRCLIAIQGISCPRWWTSSWQCYVLIGQFIFLAWCLTRPAIWLGRLLVLSFVSTLRCIVIVLWFGFGVGCIN